MKLTGILDYSLGNFLCLRGFASMGELHDHSEPDPSFQRDLLKLHEEDMVAFLNEGEYLFFPEVILCATLSPEDTHLADADELYRSVRVGEKVTNLKFPGFKISSLSKKVKAPGDMRSFRHYQTGTLDVNAKQFSKFSRIDGNHRLSATAKSEKFRKHNTPYCLLLFRSTEEAARFSRALFHNINYKSVPLTMEQNLELILDDSKLFPDDDLKKEDSFGWPYYLARKLHNKDLDLLPNIQNYFSEDHRTKCLKIFEFLISRGVLAENEHALRRLTTALSQVNAQFNDYEALKESTNYGLLTAFLYFHLDKSVPLISFIRWVLANHIHEIEDSNPSDVVAIFSKILLKRKRTIFVSMPFGKDETENHFTEINSVVETINREYPDLKPQLKVQRVDFHSQGTSYNIRQKIDEFMDNCGLLIANLTYFNPNVYHEIGFMDGKARALNSPNADVILFLDESVAAENQYVGFNLQGSNQIRFKRTAEFTKKLKDNIEKHYSLKQDDD